MRFLISAVCALTFCLLTTGAWADSVPIQNASFELVGNGLGQVVPTSVGLNQLCGPGCAFNANPIPGWMTTGATGSFMPGSFFSSVPDGSIVAYTNLGTISQTLTGISLLPNSVYTLSVDVGRRSDFVAANYSLNLLNGSNFFCTSGSTSDASITGGTFVNTTLTCATGATVPAGFLGIDLIGLGLNGGGSQVDFDNVRLNVTTSSVSTPEPSALALTFVGLFMGGLLFVRSRRNQYLQGASS
jgi:hapalindole biogenesis HpiC1 cyclase-like protein